MLNVGNNSPKFHSNLQSTNKTTEKSNSDSEIQSLFEKTSKGVKDNENHKILENVHFVKSSFNQSKIITGSEGYKVAESKIEELMEVDDELIDLLILSEEEIETFNFSKTTPLTNYSPTNSFMSLLAEKYKTKYGVDIHIFNFDPKGGVDGIAATLTPYLNSLDRSVDQIEGIVISPQKGHALPLLLQVKDGRITAFLLDVLGNDENICQRNTVFFLVQQQIPYFVCSDKRQADIFSCRIGALVTLRNALTDLKHLELSDITERIKFNEQERSNSFTLPPTWGAAHDQIFADKSADLQENKPTRALRGKPKKTLAEAREGYKGDVEVNYQFQIRTQNQIEKIQKVVNEISIYTPEIDATTSGQGQLVTFSWKQKESKNLYMQNKGKRAVENY